MPQDIDARDLVLPRPLDEAFQERHGLVSGAAGEDVHVRMDRERFRQKVRVVPTYTFECTPTSQVNASAKDEAQIPRPVNEEQQKLDEKRRQEAAAVAAESPEGEVQDEGDQRREKIKEVRINGTSENMTNWIVHQMMIHAWDGYRKHAWGANELRPISRTPHSGSVFGPQKLGDSLIFGLIVVPCTYVM